MSTNQQKSNPSSKCNQVSLTLGELYNDIIMCCGRPTAEMDKFLKKQLADCAKRIDNMIAMSEKDCYDRGWEDCKISACKPKETGIERLKDVEA